MKVEFDFDRDVESHHLTAYLAQADIAEDFKESGLSRLEFCQDNDHFRSWVIEQLFEDSL